MKACIADSRDIFSRLDEIEPRSLHGQPKVIWHKAEGCYVFNESGRKYIDFTSGVLIANCGHNHPKVNKAIRDVLDQGLLTSYIFVNHHRIQLIEKILQHVPPTMTQVALFCTGSEAIEVSIKMAKNYAKTQFGARKKYVLSFDGSFHGRTLGSQLAGGIPALKTWIGGEDATYLQIPFPDTDYPALCDFHSIINEALTAKNITAEEISCAIFETYQGGAVKFAPPEYMKQLRAWCTANNIVLILDEVQAGFGRTGKWWGFEHYGIVPDLIACGKGISSSLPVSAVIGPRKLLDQFPPGAMSTTHSGNPLCAAAAYASITAIEEENLVANAVQMGLHLKKLLDESIAKNSSIVKGVYGKGLVYGIHVVDNQGNPDAIKAQEIVDEAVAGGLMLFNPVGLQGATIKINPPLVIDESTLNDGFDILCQSVKKCERKWI